MKIGPLQTHLISLLLALTICGAGLATTWDFADFHDGHILHIDHAAPHVNDMDNVKHKQLIPPPATVTPYVVTLAEPALSFLSPTPVQLISPQLFCTRSCPSRASPA